MSFAAALDCLLGVEPHFEWLARLQPIFAGALRAGGPRRCAAGEGKYRPRFGRKAGEAGEGCPVEQTPNRAAPGERRSGAPAATGEILQGPTSTSITARIPVTVRPARA